MPVEVTALEQIANMARLPVLAGHIAIMPDVHAGSGSTVGSVIPTRGAIIPACVGSDLGCGMIALQTNLNASDLPESLSSIRASIEKAIPVGFAGHLKPVDLSGDSEPGKSLLARMASLNLRFAGLSLLAGHNINTSKLWLQAGTLGGGNHFIELCLDEKGSVWVMLHSGSRNIGKVIGDIATNTAKEIAIGRGFSAFADTSLAWLDEGTQEFADYVDAMTWAQEYAALNRDIMLHLLMRTLRAYYPNIDGIDAAVNCHHNFASLENHYGAQVWITRKGAVRARAGELGIIPSSMGAKSFIVRGKGNEASYCSCSHGAGRTMSRGEAKRKFKLADLEAQTAGIECRKDAAVIDEIPSAYKNIDHVMAAQFELVEIVATLKQVLCIKG